MRFKSKSRATEGPSREFWTDRLRCVPHILAVQNARLGSRLGEEDLLDLGQDIFLVVWRKLPEYVSGTSFESWVYRICFLEMLNRLRKGQRRRRVLHEVGRALAEEDERRSLMSTEKLDRFEALHRSFECLDPDETAIIRMKNFENCTFEEAARRLDMPAGTIKSRYYRGLEKLRVYLKSHEEGATDAHAARV